MCVPVLAVAKLKPIGVDAVILLKQTVEDLFYEACI